MKMQHRILFLFLIFNIQFVAANSFAADQLHFLGTSHEDFSYSTYYQIKIDPRVAIIDLMNFETINKPFPLPAVPYNRLQHFGTWIHIPSNQPCQNTRAQVLVRESVSAVTFSANGCTVKSGEWNDPYSATTFSSASDVQIDHLVPLKNAYMTGAHEWNSAKRCLYANYLGNHFHLLAVSGTENMKKGDNTPMAYIPPNKNFQCDYLKHWLQVKAIWSLRLTPKEVEAVNQAIQADHCDHAAMQMTAAEFEAQQRFMTDNSDLCRRAETQSEMQLVYFK